MEFGDLIRENITRDTAQRVLKDFCQGRDAPPDGAVERILGIDIDTLKPRSGVNWVGILPDENGSYYLGMPRDQLETLIYSAD
ncbi:MAG: hypothetical protein O2780_04800 [Proteobacteria bacterium]|jgi:hypothetical protein|nr:hypothetical protein [Pseudomonadota bacterium]MDA1300064.1 hypothetical protein [Pseudomonadota bacterium]